MRSSPLREFLVDSPMAETPALLAERQRWVEVRAVFDTLDRMAPEAAEERIQALRVSSDPVEQRAAELAALRAEAEGFLEGVAPQSTEPPTTADPIYVAGDMVGPYRIVGVIGEGGMGRVYRADDTRLLRQVALKVVTRHQVRGANLLREAQMAARLHHHNIATIHDVLEVNGRLHVVMEYLEGRPLSRVLAEDELTVARVLALFPRILAAVGHAHHTGVIHCDLKPANIQVLSGDDVKVLDFGLARLDSPARDGASSMAVAGTPRYLAPERLWGAHPSARTDIYSLGVILSEMVRRIAPTDASGRSADTSARDAEGVVVGTLFRVAARATAHDPAARYAAVSEMAADVESARSSTRAEPAPNPRWWPAAAAALAASVALLVWVLGVPGHARVGKPVLALSMAAAGTDAMSSHVAAAIAQVLEHAMSGTRDVTLARPDATRADASAADPAELGATHVLGGRVERTGQDLRIDLTVTTRDGVVLATSRVSGSLDALSSLGPALVDGVDAVMARARVPLDRRSLEEAARRQTISAQPEAFEEYAQAREYLRSSDVRDALDYAIGLLGRAVSRDPDFALAHAGLAEAYWKKYQATRENAWTDRARASALDALRLTPDDPIVRYTLALIYSGTGRREDALVEVSKAIALQPTNDDLFRLRGVLHAESGRIDRGMADLRRAMDLRPGYWENPRSAGLILFRAGRFDEAVAYFQRVTELRPSSATAYQNLGTVLQAANRIPDALDAYQRALAISPNANTYSNIGMLHHENGRYEEARRAYEESIRLLPRSAITHRNLGDALNKLGRTADASAAYERAIALAADQLAVNPQDLDALSLQALCHAKLGHAAESRRLVEQVLGAPTLAAVVRYRAGVALVLAGDPASGVGHVAAAVQAGYSRAVAARDDDLASVRSHPRMQDALGAPAGAPAAR